MHCEYIIHVAFKTESAIAMDSLLLLKFLWRLFWILLGFIFFFIQMADGFNNKNVSTEICNNQHKGRRKSRESVERSLTAEAVCLLPGSPWHVNAAAVIACHWDSFASFLPQQSKIHTEMSFWWLCLSASNDFDEWLHLDLWRVS